MVFVYFPTLPLSYIHIGYYIFSIKLIRMSPFLLCCSEIFQSIGMSGLWWLIWWWMVDFLFWFFCVGQFHSTCLSLCHICSLHTFCYVFFFFGLFTNLWWMKILTPSPRMSLHAHHSDTVCVPGLGDLSLLGFVTKGVWAGRCYPSGWSTA